MGQSRPGMLDMCARRLVPRGMPQKRLQVRDGVLRAVSAELDERKSVMSTRRRLILLENMAIRLRCLVDHPDPRVTDGDLLKNDRVPRGRLEGQPEGRERFVEFSVLEEADALVIIVDALIAVAPEELLPEGHS